MGLEATPAPGWEGEQFQVDIKPEPQGLSPWFGAVKRKVPSPVPPHKASRCPTTDISIVSADSSPSSKVPSHKGNLHTHLRERGSRTGRKVT